jgi:hypothetical protein
LAEGRGAETWLASEAAIGLMEGAALASAQWRPIGDEVRPVGFIRLCEPAGCTTRSAHLSGSRIAVVPGR